MFPRIWVNALLLSALWEAKKVQQDAIDGLHSASGFVRRELANRLKLRAAPEISLSLTIR